MLETMYQISNVKKGCASLSGDLITVKLLTNSIVFSQYVVDTKLARIPQWACVHDTLGQDTSLCTTAAI